MSPANRSGSFICNHCIISPCSLDWPLLIQGLDAIGNPLAAAVAGAFTLFAARMALDAFRKQKGIEQRVEWYRLAHSQIAAASLVFRKAQMMGGPWPEIAIGKIRELRPVIDDAFLSAAPRSFGTIELFTSDLATVSAKYDQGKATSDDFRILANLAQAAANAIASDMRGELMLEEFRPMDRALKRRGRLGTT